MGSVAKSDEDVALSSTRWNTGLGFVGTVVTVLAAWWGVANPAWLLYVTVGEAVLLIVLYVVLVRLRSTSIDLRGTVPKSVQDRALYLEFHDAAMKQLGTAARELQAGHLRLFGDGVRQAQIALVRHMLHSRQSERTIHAVDLTVDIPLIETRSDYLVQNETFIRSGGTVKRVFIVQQSDLTDAARAALLQQLMKQHIEAGVEVGLQWRELIREPRLLQDFIACGTSAVIVEGQQAGPDYEHGHSEIYFDQSHIDAYRRIFDTVWQGVVGPNSRVLARRFLAQMAASSESAGTIDLNKLLREES